MSKLAQMILISKDKYDRLVNNQNSLKGQRLAGGPAAQPPPTRVNLLLPSDSKQSAAALKAGGFTPPPPGEPANTHTLSVDKGEEEEHRSWADVWLPL